MRALLFLLFSCPMLYGQRTDCPNYQLPQLIVVTKDDYLKIGNAPTTIYYTFDKEAAFIGKVNNISKITYSHDGYLFGIRDADLYTGSVPCDKDVDWFSKAKRVGNGGWEIFKAIFFDYNEIFYAVTNDGNLYKGPRPDNENICWHKHVAIKIGSEDWHQYEALFFHPDGDLYAVNKDGSFVKGKPPTAPGNWLESTKRIGNGGWQDLTHFIAINRDGNLWCVNKKNGNIYKGLPPANERDNYIARAELLGTKFIMYPLICLK